MLELVRKIFKQEGIMKLQLVLRVVYYIESNEDEIEQKNVYIKSFSKEARLGDKGRFVDLQLDFIHQQMDRNIYLPKSGWAIKRFVSNDNQIFSL